MSTIYFTRDFQMNVTGGTDMYSGRIAAPTLEACIEQYRRDLAWWGGHSDQTEIAVFDAEADADMNDTALSAAELSDLLSQPPNPSDSPPNESDRRYWIETDEEADG